MKAVVWMTLVCGLVFAAPGVHAKPPHARGEALPPGLAKQDKLPPGWQKKLHRGAVLDDDLYAHAHRLPAKETPYHERDGVITVVIGGKLVRLVEETHEILDVLSR